MSSEEGLFSCRTFFPTDVLSPQTFCPAAPVVLSPDVLSLRMFCPSRCFFPPDVLSLRTFCPTRHFSHRRFVPPGVFFPRTFCRRTFRRWTLCLGTVFRASLLYYLSSVIAISLSMYPFLYICVQRWGIVRSAKRCRHCILGFLYSAYLRSESQNLTRNPFPPPVQCNSTLSTASNSGTPASNWQNTSSPKYHSPRHENFRSEISKLSFTVCEIKAFIFIYF